MKRFIAVMTALVAWGHAAMPVAWGQTLSEFSGQGSPELKVGGDVPFVPEGKPLQGLVITLNPGWGGIGHQSGYVISARGVQSRVVEGDLNMLVAAQLRHHLIDAGAKVHMTRWDDRRVAHENQPSREEEIGARVRKAVDTRSHLFISLHHTDGDLSGSRVTVLVWPKDSQGSEQPIERGLGECLATEIEKRVYHTQSAQTVEDKNLVVASCDIPSAAIQFGCLQNREFDKWVSQWGAHRVEARAAYDGIVRFWGEHGAELVALRTKLFPGSETTTATASTGPTLTGGVSPVIQDLARQLWVAGRPPETTTEAQWLIDNYRRRVLTDSTFFYLSTSVEKTTDSWVLRGKSNYDILTSAAEGLLLCAGCRPLRNEIEALPSARLGETRFGVCQMPMAMTWGGPAEGDDVQTQLLLGDRVFLLEETTDTSYLLIHGADGYVGWVRSDAIARMDGKQFAAWEAAQYATLIRDHRVEDFRLPNGASLPIQSDQNPFGISSPGALSPSTPVSLLLPKPVRATGGQPTVQVPAEHLRMPEPAEQLPGMLAARAALQYLMTPYVFGGRSRLGLDCSGLTDVAYAAVGLALPRDARQQILVGQMVATPTHLPPLKPGDLLFFCDDTGRIVHVAISTGGARYLHASPPEVHVGSVNPADKYYDKFWRGYFCFARRPLP